MSLNELRIRLEGRLEVVETATSHLEALDRLLVEGTWARDHAARKHLRAWSSLEPRLEEALEAVRRANGDETVQRFASARARLSRSITRHLPNTAAGRFGQLSDWLRLAEATGLPERTEQPVAEARVKVRPPGWIGILVLAAVMFVLSQLVAAGILLLLGIISALWLTKVSRYRLFRDVLVVEREGEPPVQVALNSLERVEARPGVTLRGLIDVELPADRELKPLCRQLNQLASERRVLEREQQALARFPGAPGVWVSATLQSGGSESATAVEVLKFDKHGPPSPLQLKTAGLSVPTTREGFALLCETGILFIPQSAEARVRKLLFDDSGPIELLEKEQAALTSFPAALILEKLEVLRGVHQVLWLERAQAAAFTVQGDEASASFASGRLSLKLDDASRASLLRLSAPA